MNAEAYRRKAKYFLTVAQQISRLEDRAAMVEIAAFWMRRAEETEQNNRIVQQQTQPEKEPEGERS